MPIPDEPTSKTVADSPQSAATPATGDLENQTLGRDTGVSNIVGRWKREDLLKRGSLGLRGFGLLFSLLAFIIMASNKHGDWKEFGIYEEYRYVLAIAILSSLYTGLQILRQVQELSTGRDMISPKNMLVVDFFGDQNLSNLASQVIIIPMFFVSGYDLLVGKFRQQIVAYLLISAASSAVPLTNRMREGADNIFTDSSASAISMEFLAFILLALSAMISGYKLSNQSYI